MYYITFTVTYSLYFPIYSIVHGITVLLIFHENTSNFFIFFFILLICSYPVVTALLWMWAPSSHLYTQWVVAVYLDTPASHQSQHGCQMCDQQPAADLRRIHWILCQWKYPTEVMFYGRVCYCAGFSISTKVHIYGKISGTELTTLHTCNGESIGLKRVGTQS